MTAQFLIATVLFLGSQNSFAQKLSVQSYLLPQGCGWIEPVSLKSFDTAKGDPRQEVSQQITSFKPDEVFYGGDGDDHGADWKTRALVKLVRHSDRKFATFMVYGSGLDVMKSILPTVFPKAQSHSYVRHTQNMNCGCILKLQKMRGEPTRNAGVEYTAIKKNGQAIGLSEKKASVTSNCYFPMTQTALGQSLLHELGIQ